MSSSVVSKVSVLVRDVCVMVSVAHPPVCLSLCAALHSPMILRCLTSLREVASNWTPLVLMAPISVGKG